MSLKVSLSLRLVVDTILFLGKIREENSIRRVVWRVRSDKPDGPSSLF